ncbi:MAG: PAS domain S-box protein [Chloroflexi bacterium]|nr:PAS domain S-box protein [Chloroflexota bacterium]
MMVSDHGIWFWVNLVYSYLLISFGIFCMIQAYFRASSPYRTQASVLLVGAIAPLAASLLSLSDIEPFAFMDTTPFGFTVSGLALAWGLFLLRLLDVVPVARDSVINNMPDAMFVLNTLNRVVDMNPAAEKILGQPASEVLGQPASQVIEENLGLFDDAENIVYGRSEIVVTSENTQVPYELNVAAVFEENGRQAGRLVMLRDITDRKRADTAINHRIEFEKTISTISSRLVGIADINEAIDDSLKSIGIFSGARQSHLFFLNEEGTHVDNTHEWCADGVLPNISELQNLNVISMMYWIKLLREGQVVTIFDVSEMPDGTQNEKQFLEQQGITSFLAVPLFVEQKLEGFIGLENIDNPKGWTAADLLLLRTCSDVMGNAFERNRAENRIRDANRELQTALEQLKSSQAQLMQSDKLAAIGQLVSGVAHELNNPLMAISGTVELMQVYVNDDLAKEDLQNLHSNTMRATSIVSNLLSFARKSEPEKKYISINETIESVIRLRSYELNLDDIELVEYLDDTLPNTMADFQQLQQVFLNFIINAEQAIKEAHGKGKIFIQTRLTGDYVRIDFIDDGPGIPHEVKARIFEPFFTTKDVGKGTGLGLSICYGIIQEHNGQISVESAVGKGTTFSIELPVTGKSTVTYHEKLENSNFDDQLDRILNVQGGDEWHE